MCHAYTPDEEEGSMDTNIDKLWKEHLQKNKREDSVSMMIVVVALALEVILFGLGIWAVVHFARKFW
jgi:hypothetical protein